MPVRQIIETSCDEWRMSQADLVRATGLAKASVSELVGRKRPFTVEQMNVAAKAFGLPGSVFMPKDEVLRQEREGAT